MIGYAPEPLQQVAIRGAAGLEVKSRVHAVDGRELVFGMTDGTWMPPVDADVCLRWSSWRGLHECPGRRLADLDDALRIEMHEPPTCLQRRRYARVPATVPARLHLESGEQLDAITLDLSEGGVRLVLRHCPGLPEEVRVELASLPSSELQLARVVRQDAEDGSTTIVVAFVPPVPQAQALRSDVLARQARHRLLGV